MKLAAIIVTAFALGAVGGYVAHRLAPTQLEQARTACHAFHPNWPTASAGFNYRVVHILAGSTRHEAHLHRRGSVSTSVFKSGLGNLRHRFLKRAQRSTTSF